MTDHVFEPGKKYTFSDRDIVVLRDAARDFAAQIKETANIDQERWYDLDLAAQAGLEAIFGGITDVAGDNELRHRVYMMAVLLELGALGYDRYLKAAQQVTDAVLEFGGDPTNERPRPDTPGTQAGGSEAEEPDPAGSSVQHPQEGRDGPGSSE